MINLAVIGDPIDHSLSPAVHGAILNELQIPYHYQKVQVKKGELEQFLQFVIDEKIDGFNLTMPHKVDILPYLDEIDDEAVYFRSVNTVRVTNGKFYGYNTDAGGYVASLKQCGKTFSGNRVTFLGSGGVVRTLALKAAREGAEEIRVLSRRVSASEEVCSMVRTETGVRTLAAEMQMDTMTKICCDTDILIHATPLGMHGVTDNFTDLSFLDALPNHALVSDLIYNPEETLLIQEAKKCGCQTMNGLGMLIFQAILADEIYLGQEFDQKALYSLVYEKVKKQVV